MLSADQEQDKTATLQEAYRAVHQISNVSKIERSIDGLAEKVTAGGESPTLTFINQFYNENQATIQAAAAGFASVDNKAVETAISTFTESAKVVMKGLDALSQAHPFIGVAVVAFKLVVTLDLTRRENNQKVVAIRVQMQDTMCVLFQLRHMKDPEEFGPDGITVKDRMQPLIERVAKSITECGAACDAYLKKSFLARTLKSKIYESRLATYASVFADYRTELEQALLVHTALGVEAANEKLDKQQETLKKIEDRMLDIFKKLETPRERDISKFIEANGGARACAEKDDLLTKMIAKSGESLSAVAQRSTSKGRDEIVAARKTLLKELAEDVDEIFKKNLIIFEAKMMIQHQQITDVVEKQGQQIMSALLSGSHEKLKDTDLQNLWKEMGWKGSVKARHFVLALRDYFVDQSDVATRPTTPGLPKTPLDSEKSFPEFEISPGSHEHPDVPINTNDRWTLKHINIAHLQPILESIDDDGTGFISIKEANTFAIERPKGWTLLHWVAFWAKGWHHSISKYRNQIYLDIQKMHRNLDRIKPGNGFNVDWYLDMNCFRTIDQLLRATKTVDENEHLDSSLTQLTESFVASEEVRLEKNLKSVGYNIDSPATVSLITGPGRIERYVYPLLCLLLRHHARIIEAACHHILHVNELDYWAESLNSVVSVIKQRVENLGAIYRQVYVDAKSQLENFAFGMYRLIWECPNSWKPSDNSFAAWQDTSTDKNDNSDNQLDPNDVSILKYPTEDTFSYKSVDADTPPMQLDSDEPNFPSSLEGMWTGHCYHTDDDGDCISDKGLLLIRVDVVNGESLSGRVESCSGKADVSGSCQGAGDGLFQIKLSLGDETGGSTIYQLSGTFDLMIQRIIGTYTVEGEEEDDENDEGESDDDGGDSDGDEEVVGSGDEGEEGAIDRKEGADESEEVNDGDEANTGGGKKGSQSGNEDEQETEEDDITEADESEVEEGPDANERTKGQKDTLRQEGISEGTGAGKGKAEGRSQASRTFTLTRTPPELFRFRYGFEELHKNPAKARWAFACKAVRYLIQKRRWTWKFLKERIAERRQVTNLRLRDWDEEDKIAPNRDLTEEEKDTLLELDSTLSPAFSGLCHALVDYTSTREAYLFKNTCASCARTILKPGYVCLQCINEDHSQMVSLCPDCINESSNHSNFVHDKAHSMLKTFTTLHDFRISFLIKDARALVNRIKGTAKDLEANHKGLATDSKAKSKANKYICACCNEPVSLPFYVCAICTRDTFVCNDCDSKGVAALPDGSGPNHEALHIMIRLCNSREERFEHDVADATVKRIEGLEKIMQDRLGLLDERLTTLKSKLEEQFKGFETLLKQLVEEH